MLKTKIRGRSSSFSRLPPVQESFITRQLKQSMDQKKENTQSGTVTEIIQSFNSTSHCAKPKISKLPSLTWYMTERSLEI